MMTLETIISFDRSWCGPGKGKVVLHRTMGPNSSWLELIDGLGHKLPMFFMNHDQVRTVAVAFASALNWPLELEKEGKEK